MDLLGQPAWFGEYRLTSRIATGGMAEVYIGRHITQDGRFGPLVAVKRLLPHLVKDPNIVRMFLNEARITAQIHHPNVVQVLDLGQENGEPFIAMELLEGNTLAELRKRSAEDGKRVPLGITLHILCEACRGLAAAHAAKDDSGQPLGLVHRDFTPDNIHVSVAGEVKVIDFGVAKTQAWGSNTEPGTLKGKFFYMSPEMILARPLDHRADLFAAGVMLYEELCGRRPFTGKSVDEVVLRIAEGNPRPPRSFDPSVPPALEAICLKALDRDPERRFPSLPEFIQAIEGVGGSARVATQEEVAAYINALFPLEKDTKRQTLRRARAADPSTPGFPPVDASSDAAPTAAHGYQAAAPAEPVEPLEPEPPTGRGFHPTDINPSLQVAPGEAPLPRATDLDAGVAELGPTAPTSLPQGLPPDELAVAKGAAPKVVAAVLVLAVVGAGAWFFLPGKSLPPAEALTLAEKAEKPQRAKLLDGLADQPEATADQLERAGALLLDAGADDAALELATRWAKRAPEELGARLLEAKAATRLRKGKRAETALAAAAELAPKDPRVDLAMADLRERQGDVPGTMEALARALRRDPELREVKRRYAILLSQAGRLDEAAAALEDVLRRGFDARAASELGFVEFRRKKTNDAEAMLRRALKADPKVMEAHYYLGAVLYQKGEVKDARAAYLEADTLAGDDSRPLLALCEVDAQSRSPELEETKKRLQERFPDQAAEWISKCAVPPAEPAP